MIKTYALNAIVASIENFHLIAVYIIASVQLSIMMLEAQLNYASFVKATLALLALHRTNVQLAILMICIENLV